MEVHEKRFLDAVAEAERGLEHAGVEFRSIDTASSGLVAAATTTGARLSSAHKITLAAKRALGLLQVRALVTPVATPRHHMAQLPPLKPCSTTCAASALRDVRGRQAGLTR
jgi:hypothetical protein